MQIGPGTRIRHADLQEIGTLGCVLRQRDLADPRRYLLSAAHVLNPGGFGRRGDLIEAEDEGGGWKPVAELVDWTAINGLVPDGLLIDAAIAEMRPEFATGWQPVAQALRPVAMAPSAFPGMDLRVYGAVSQQLVEAEVQSSDGSILLDYRLEQSGLPLFAMKVRGQIFYGRNLGGWQAVTQGGDSGALVVDAQGRAVGLHIGSTSATAELNVSVCTPMQRILDKFGLVLDVGQGAPAPAGSGGFAAPLPAASAPAVATTDSLSEAARVAMGVRILPLLEPHNYNGGASWQLTPRGVMLGAELPRTGGQPQTVARVWTQFGRAICQSARSNKVPVELIVATICTESLGDPEASRVEPDGRRSVGLMQTLIDTARVVMRDPTIDATWLVRPENSIDAGTAYIANERRHSAFDPPQVAAIYNAGSLRPAHDNRWRFAQYVGSRTHVDSFVEWFNDCFAYFDSTPPDLVGGAPSFWKLLKG
ncbi:transglycosylase SLT domain-containing protein [Roseateles sp. DXS20W]|uniref:Transglycosylase SLT domain-containing protein n=1 Tax=Pelomonas lactea TaxID=3299030 RepID=A0ABW7GPT2_9BURK